MSAPIRHKYHDDDSLCQPPKERKQRRLSDALDDLWLEDHEVPLSQLNGNDTPDVWDKGLRRRVKRLKPVPRQSAAERLCRAWGAHG